MNVGLTHGIGDSKGAQLPLSEAGGGMARRHVAGRSATYRGLSDCAAEGASVGVSLTAGARDCALSCYTVRCSALKDALLPDREVNGG